MRDTQSCLWPLRVLTPALFFLREIKGNQTNRIPFPLCTTRIPLTSISIIKVKISIYFNSAVKKKKKQLETLHKIVLSLSRKFSRVKRLILLSRFRGYENFEKYFLERLTNRTKIFFTRIFICQTFPYTKTR